MMCLQQITQYMYLNLLAAMHEHLNSFIYRYTTYRYIYIYESADLFSIVCCIVLE